MVLELLEPVVVIVSILGFTFYLNHRLEDKLNAIAKDNTDDHNKLYSRVLKIEDAVGVNHE